MKAWNARKKIYSSNKKLFFLVLLTVLATVSVILFRYSLNRTSSVSMVNDGIVVDGNTLHPCEGNATDKCKGAPSIDFYPTGSEDAINPEYRGVGVHREIMGVITNANGKIITIRTTSGRLFTVTFPIDPITNFNSVRTDTAATAGDTLHIDYTEDADQHATTVNSQHLFRSALLIMDNPKADADIKKY